MLVLIKDFLNKDYFLNKAIISVRFKRDNLLDLLVPKMKKQTTLIIGILLIGFLGFFHFNRDIIVVNCVENLHPLFQPLLCLR